MADAVVGLLTLPDTTPADEQLLARLRSVQGVARYDIGDVDGARALLREGVAALEPGSPSPGRARLLASLGWTYWRGGPVEEAAPWLERAVQEAEASADAGTLPLVSMIEEGLSRARRAAADNTITWLAGNQAEYMVELGRLDAALAYLDEAIAAAAAGGTPLRAHMYLHQANLYRLRGDIAAADRVLSEVEELSFEVEPQLAAELMLGRAWARWPDDPSSALEALALAASDPDLWDLQRVLVAHELARMALRLDDRKTLERAIELHREARPAEGPRQRQAEWRWLDGLADDTASLTVEAAAAELEDLGHKLKAADAWADAAIMAARSERASAALERAVALIEEIGLHPLLGPLPETRWLEKLDASEVASDG